MKRAPRLPQAVRGPALTAGVRGGVSAGGGPSLGRGSETSMDAVLNTGVPRSSARRCRCRRCSSARSSGAEGCCGAEAGAPGPAQVGRQSGKRPRDEGAQMRRVSAPLGRDGAPWARPAAAAPAASSVDAQDGRGRRAQARELTLGCERRREAGARLAVAAAQAACPASTNAGRRASA